MNTQAKTVRDGQGYWGVEYKGQLVVTEESYQVASNVTDAINHPERQGHDEAVEMAERIVRGPIET